MKLSKTIVCDSSDDDVNYNVPHISRKEISDILGMKPIMLKSYRTAFVHKSMLQHLKGKKNVMDYMLESNERLELLGDSVLGLIITDILYTKFPNKDEGFLTRMKTKIVRREGCAMFARKLGLGKHIFTKNKIHKNSDKILEDTFEAFVGAIYLDLGYEFVWNFIHRLVNKYINFKLLVIDTNYKDILLRCCQKKGYPYPKYLEACSNGNNINKNYFEIIAEVAAETPKTGRTKIIRAQGSGHNKKSAEQSASYNLLLELDAMFNYKLLQEFMFRDSQ